jgi:hypothetical protein
VGRSKELISKPPFTKGDFKASISERQSVLVAKIREITRSALIFTAAHLVLSLDNHDKTKSTRQ